MFFLTILSFASATSFSVVRVLDVELLRHELFRLCPLRIELDTSPCIIHLIYYHAIRWRMNIA